MRKADKPAGRAEQQQADDCFESNDARCHRMLREMPCLEAITTIAPTVRFIFFEILSVPTFCFANPLSMRKSVAVHGRATRFAFLANIIT
jgi:hypothetical protein